MKKYQSTGEVQGSKGSKASRIIASISGAVTGAAGIGKNIYDRRKKKKLEKAQIREDNRRKREEENRKSTLKELEEMGTGYRKDGAKMKTGGMTNSNKKVSALLKATGRTGGISTAPKTAVPKAKYGMTMKKKK